MKKRQKAMTKAKRKVKIIARKPTGPRIFDGMKGRFADLGEFEFHGKGDDFEVEWRHFGEERKSALFSELYSAESKAAERREVGELIANIIQREGQGVIKSIGGLNETMKVADPYWRMEHEWREWAKPLSDDTTEQSKSAAEDPIDVAVKLAEAASERAPRLVKCGLITSDNSMGAYKTCVLSVAVRKWVWLSTAGAEAEMCDSIGA